MSHDATAKCSDCGENEMSDIPSSGGAFRATSFEISPTVALDVALAALLPNSPDMSMRGRVSGECDLLVQNGIRCPIARCAFYFTLVCGHCEPT